MDQVHFVVPAGVDDPAQPSGGNTYDRRVSDGLSATGWQVHEHPVGGDWPAPDHAAIDELGRSLASVPDGELVLIDGLIGSAAADVLPAEARRLRLVPLVHLPLGSTTGPARAREAAVFAAATAVITTSAWTRDRLLDWYRLPADRVHVAHPGVDRHVEPDTDTDVEVDAAAEADDGADLLCVAAVAEHKGQDVLVEALGAVTDLRWRCRLVGPLDRDPAFVERLHAQLARNRITDRVEFAGPRVGAELAHSYAAANLLVSASRGETYGMALAEAIARGLPVISTEVGGVREALGAEPSGLPGLLVPANDPEAFAAALRRWLTEPELRGRLRAAAAARRATLPSWTATARAVGAALAAADTPAN
jgi:glycosyltransferase involved in cell wall biosynthesis